MEKIFHFTESFIRFQILLEEKQMHINRIPEEHVFPPEEIREARPIGFILFPNLRSLQD